ncbi:MAG TPA: ATP-binding protein [Verrucomicrobiae bacterium]
MTQHRKKLLTAWRLVFWLLAWGCLATPAAQPYQPMYRDPMLEPWRWSCYPELSGLAGQCVGEGPGGVMWFGTVDGLWSYDGIEWINQKSNDGAGAASICGGTAGDLYVASTLEIRKCHDGKWGRIFYGFDRSFQIHKIIAARDGSLWAATSWGLLHGQDSQWTLFTTPDLAGRTIRSHTPLTVSLYPAEVLGKPRPAPLPTVRHDLTDVCEDRRGRIWLGTDGGEILCFDYPATNAPAEAARWTLYNESDGLVCNRTPSLLELQNGFLWVVSGVDSTQASVFDGATWQKVDLAAAGLPRDGGNLLQTRDGTIWLSCRYVLAACRNGHWTTYTKPTAPIPSAHNFIFESSDGALWICGPNAEIQRVDYDTSRWTTLSDLNFQWESPAGEQWFLHRDGRVVVRDGKGQWTSYGVEDGLIDAPVLLLGARSGNVWVAGSHDHTAATAQFDGHKWTRFIHADFAWGVDWRAGFESSDGSVWFGAAVDSSGPKQHLDGLLQFRHGQWIHHHQPGRVPPGQADTNPAVILPATQRPEPIGKFFCLGESRHGKIWAARSIIAVNDGRRWSIFTGQTNIRHGVIESSLTSKDGDLWFGTRQFGALRYDGQSWRQYQGKDSLVANSVRSLAQTTDGIIWAATDRDVSCFDGATWTGHVLPEALNVPEEGGSLKASSGGRLWINRFARDWVIRAWPKAPRPGNTNFEFWTVCHQFRGKPPATVIFTQPQTISPPGNLSLFWGGMAAWQEAHVSPLQFSYRLDNEPWSAFTADRGESFFTLASGRHHFEVRARDRDFNVDPTPAALDFTVLPPVWRQTWFIVLMAGLAGLIVILIIRLLLEQARLRAAQADLELRVQQRTAQLEAANQELESFSYSVSHDLRAPLRAIDGFTRIFLDDYGSRLDATGQDHLHRVRAAAERMAQLIEDLLKLSRITRSELHREAVNLSGLAADIAAELQKADPGRRATFTIQPGLSAQGDARLLQIALENLFGNAWKFTNFKPEARIEFGQMEHQGQNCFFIRDNGAGFDMAYAEKLFGAFQRLHRPSDFPGTGIGLATVQRIIHRHGGIIHAEAAVDRGATFYFTLPNLI